MQLVTIYTSIRINEISYVKSLLEGSGIKAVVLDETIGQLAPHHLWGQGGPRLAVHPDDVEMAREIIKDYESGTIENED